MNTASDYLLGILGIFMEDRESDPFSKYSENKLLLNSIFMKEKMSRYSKQIIDKYFKSLLRAHKRVESSRDF